MNDLPQNWMRLCIAIAGLAALFTATNTVNAQAPEIIGEPDLNVLRTNEAFDPVSNTWSKKTPMPTKRWNIDTAVVQGKIYAIGGSCCTVSCDPLDTVEIYDPANNSWITGTPLPFPVRGNGAAGAANGIIYVVGGQTGCGGEVNTNEAFDPATNMWSTKAPMQTARYQFGIATVFDSNLGHEVLYAIGGGADGVAIDTVEMYDPGTDQWTFRQHMPTPRYVLEVAAVNGKIYAIGGVCTTGGCHTVEEYDPATDTWATKAPIPTTHTGSGAAIGVVNGIIYVAGGSNNNRQLSTVDAYNPVTDTWSTVPPMPTARDSLGGLSLTINSTQ